MLHETTRHTSATGEATPARHPTFKGRQKLIGCRGGVERFREFCIPMVEHLPAKRSAGIEAPTSVGAASQTFRSSKGKTSGTFDGGTPAIGLFHGPLDTETYRSADPKVFWSEISPLSCLEDPDHAGAELPETGKARPAKRRRSDCAVEAAEMAAYKKKPEYWGLTWFSSTKVGSCSFLTSRGHGRSGDRRRCFVISTNKTAFRPSMLLRYPLKGSGWRFMSACAPAISMGWTSFRSCGIFSGISGGMSFSCGIAGPFINVWKSNNLSPGAADCISNGSPLMLRNSTLRSMSGTRTTPPLPTEHQATSANLDTGFVLPCKESGALKNFSGPVSMRLSCHGSDKSFHYLCNIQ